MSDQSGPGGNGAEPATGLPNGLPIEPAAELGKRLAPELHLGGSLLCVLSVFVLCGPFVFGGVFGGILPGSGPLVEGGSGPIPWAATMAAGVGALWGHGIFLAGWGARSRFFALSLALALPLGVGILGLGGANSGPLPLGVLPDSPAGGAALAGLLALGVFLGSSRWGAFWPVWCVALAAVLDGAPGGWGLMESPTGGAPWGPGTAAMLLDLSPRAFVMESGAVDWMRHPEVYGPVGTDRIGPELRSGAAGTVWPYMTLGLGCLACTWRILRGR